MKPLEVRFTAGAALQARPGTSKAHSGPIIKGYAAVFNAFSLDMGGYKEKISPGAFAESIKRDEVRALYYHDGAAILGRTSNSTLSLQEDRHGLRFELVLPDTQLGHDIATLVERGDLSQMSFGFSLPLQGDTWSYERGKSIRTLRQVDLFEVSVVPTPAYEQTSVTLRQALDTVVAATLADYRRRLEALAV